MYIILHIFWTSFRKIGRLKRIDTEIKQRILRVKGV